MIKINLGCGVNWRDKESDGYVGIDCYDFGQNCVLDIEHEFLPFKTNSVNEIISNHVLEHLKDVRFTLNECWRVLKKYEKFEIRVPYGLWEGSSKPVHHQLITECWFDFLTRPKTYIYGYKRWKILKMERVNNGKEIHCIMTPDK